MQIGFSRAVIVVAAAALAVAGCGQTTDDSDDTTSPDPESGEPAITLEDETFLIDDGQAPVISESSQPVLTGVADEQAQHFTATYRGAFEGELERISAEVADYLDDKADGLPTGCVSSEHGECTTTVTAEVVHAEIHLGYASIAYEYTYAPPQGVQITRALSHTMDLQGGSFAQLSDFADPDSLDLSGVADLSDSCSRSYDERADSGQFEVFALTAEGLYISERSDVAGAGCGVPSAVIAWDELPDPDEDVSAESSADCREDSSLPDGADARICDTDPQDTGGIGTDDSGVVEFALPSENIVCAMGADEVDCMMIDPATRITLPADAEASTGEDRDPGSIGDLATLEYGDLAVNGPFACLSDEVGLACWNTETEHGLFLSRASTSTW